MKPVDISEFSYGYAVTESLIKQSRYPVQAAPIFPSLINEGKSGGYDVAIPFSGFPLFLQFKLSDLMVRRTAIETKAGLFEPEFYRFHLRPTRDSRQHPLLLDLESQGCSVYYVAPLFSRVQELNDAYINNNILDRSIFLKPSLVGPLPDDEPHHVSFKPGYPVYRLSEPQVVRRNTDGNHDFWKDLIEGEDHYRLINSSKESIFQLAADLIRIFEKHLLPLWWFKEPDVHAKLQSLSPMSQISYIARIVLGCDVLVVRKKVGWDPT